MTTRERHLLIIVFSVVGVGLLGLFTYLIVLGPILEKNKLIRQKQLEVAQLENDITEIQILKKRFEAARQQSLPNDPVGGVGVAREQYGNLLRSLLRRAEFGTGSFKIAVHEADSKTAPTIAPKKPAYTKLTYELTVKGKLYNLIAFMQAFYQQPLLHTIKKFNIQRPSDSRAQQARQLDVTMTIEAIVLDNAQVRGTLLPVIREIALVSGGPAFVGLNSKSVVEGHGSAIAPTGVLADMPREYLAIDGKNIFFGPPPKTPTEPVEETPPEDDHSPFITLTSIVGYEDGKIVAEFRDKLDNHNYIVTQSPSGVIGVLGEYELRPGEWRLIPGYSERKPGDILFYGTTRGQNRCEWRVRRVLLDGLIMEKLDLVDSGTKPKSHPLALIGGGPGAVLAVPEGKIYRVGLGQSLDANARRFPRPITAPVRMGTYGIKGSGEEAWKAIYAPLVNGLAPSVETSRGR